MYLVLRRGRRLLAATLILCAVPLMFCGHAVVAATANADAQKENFIRYVEFNVPYAALDRALELDIESHGTQTPVSWVELLAYAAAKSGGEVKNVQLKTLNATAELLQSGKNMEELAAGMKYYSYYKEAYGAVLGGLVGEYEEQLKDPATGEILWEKKYGLKAFSPVAKGYPYEEYDDFGASRSYGYKRQHLGHDLLGQVGTPIIAVESGVIEAIGWNQYGGWRIGVRSTDGKRYYYYAHLRKNYPYNTALKEGSAVKAGQVLGYLGRTGYSAKENTNNIEAAHLHFGLELVFDPSQKESDNEIWVDVYPLTRLLRRHQSQVQRVENSKEYERVYDFRESAR